MDGSVPAIDPGRAALLVMDFEPAIIGNIDGVEALLARVGRAIAATREAGMTVGYVRVAFTDDDYARIPGRNRFFAGAAQSHRLADGGPDTAVHASIAPEAGDIQVRKTRVGAFSTTDLDRQLVECGIDTLVLVGVSTGGVVLSTVRDASDRDYRLYVLEDGCADRDPELHMALMSKVFPRQAHVISVEEYVGLLRGKLP